MTATFTIEGELSQQGLLDAKAAIDDLLGERATAGINEAVPDESDLALRKTRLLRAWSGDATWLFMSTIAEHYEPDEEFTFDDLAETFGADKGTVKSWHRSASKIMNKVDAELGSEPTFLDARWDGARQNYRLTQIMRDALVAASI